MWPWNRNVRRRVKKYMAPRMIARFERLEPRIALHAADEETWLHHALEDDAILDATAANPPVANMVAAAPQPGALPSDVGQWGALQNWPIEFINALMLPTGKVMGYDRTLNLRLWDPTANTFVSPADPGYQLFCTGMSLLSDGREVASTPASTRSRTICVTSRRDNSRAFSWFRKSTS